MHTSNSLHGITLKFILFQLKAHFGFKKMGEIIAVRCFLQDPSISSSLVFLRKTEWARKKVEELYMQTPFNADTFLRVQLNYDAHRKLKGKSLKKKNKVNLIILAQIARLIGNIHLEF